MTPSSSTCHNPRLRPLFEPDKFTVFNIAPFSPGSEEQLAREMVEYHDRTGEDIVLYCLSFHPEGFPAIRKAEYLVDSYRKLRRALENSGIRLGVLMQSTLGHWPRVDRNEEPWNRSITLEGKQKRFCPIDPGCRRYLHDVAHMVALEKPCFILLDDDVHASGFFGVECFCDRHVAMFNAENGTSHTSESLREAVRNCKPGDAVCVAFQKMQRSFVNDLVDVVRGAVDEVDPTIPAGACMPYREHRFAGVTAKRVAAKGQEPVLRIDNSLYGQRTLVNFPNNIAHTLAISDWWRQEIPHLLDESDTCPHNRWSMSASLLAMKLQAAAFCGLHGSKLWYCNAHKGTFPISRAYTDVLAAQRGVCSAIMAATRESTLEGIIVPTIGGRAPWHPCMQFEPFVGDGNWGVGMAGAFGVPFHCRRDFTADGIYTLGGADSVALLGDREPEEIFRPRVLVDGEAAIALTERGLQNLTGVKAERGKLKYTFERDMAGVKYAFDQSDETPLLKPITPDAEILTQLCYSAFYGAPNSDVVAPGMVMATNPLGGRVMTTAYFAKGIGWLSKLSDMRKAWFLMALTRLGGDGWAVLNDQDVLALERQRPDGSTLLAVFNTNFDEMGTIRLRVPYLPASAEVLALDGLWHRVEAKSTVPNELELPVCLPCAHCCVIALRRDPAQTTCFS